MRKSEFQTGGYYHIYNRGVDGRDIFCDEKDYLRFLRGMREFNVVEPIGSLYLKKKIESQRGLTPLRGVKPLVEFIAFSLIPNHFHFILKQLHNKGISEFMKRLGGGYTCYFNQKHNRSGSLFQGTYKSIHITTNEYLLWLSGYIHGNPEIHKIAKEENWQWSSYQDYLGKRNGTLCDKNVIINEFKNIGEYKRLVDEIIKDSQERKDEIKSCY